MRRAGYIPPLAATLVAAAASVSVGATKVGDLVRVRGVRSNHLVGMGLVVGLQGTGDASPATREAVRRFAAACGLSAGADDFAPANSALVAVTAELPPFLHAGQRVDVAVSACGDASSLAGGTLVTTPLWAGSREQVYARAQGPVSAGGPGEHAAAGRVRLGGIVERDVPPVALEEFTKSLEAGRIALDLVRPSPQAASAVADSIAGAFPDSMFLAGVEAPSPGEVEIALGSGAREAPMRFLADVLETPVDFADLARIVVNERRGTVAAPGRIEIAPAAVGTGSLFVTIGREGPGVPGPAEGEKPLVSVTEGVQLQDLVRELQRIQVSSRDLIDVLDALVKVGALRAEIIVE